MNGKRIILADDHPLTLEGLRVFLSPHMHVVDTVTDGRALVEAVERSKPDLVILDVSMPLLNGIEAARQIKKSLPGVKIVFVTMHTSPAYLEAALQTGAKGYVVKSAAREELLEAINRVLSGEIFVSPQMKVEELTWSKDPKQAAAAMELSEREREVLQLVAEGKSGKEIAHVLHISAKTVAFHRDNVKRKLGLRTTAELTRYAVEQGIA